MLISCAVARKPIFSFMFFFSMHKAGFLMMWLIEFLKHMQQCFGFVKMEIFMIFFSLSVFLFCP